MTWLLDTHAWLWLAAEPDRVSERVRRLLADGATDVRVSVASAWEIAIKYSTGRLALPESPSAWVPDRIRRHGLLSVPIALDHVLVAATLPMHHRDPFDRLLVAQARALGATIVTSDRAIAQYDVPVLDPR